MSWRGPHTSAPLVGIPGSVVSLSSGWERAESRLSNVSTEPLMTTLCSCCFAPWLFLWLAWPVCHTRHPHNGYLPHRNRRDRLLFTLGTWLKRNPISAHCPVEIHEMNSERDVTWQVWQLKTCLCLIWLCPENNLNYFQLQLTIF